MKTIAVKVLLLERFEKAKEWLLEIPAMPPMDAAEFVSTISNAPPHVLSEAQREVLEKFPRTKLRSYSTGDIMIIADAERPDMRHFVTAEPFGFKFH